MKNKQLAKFYDRVYKKGEYKHYTEFLFGNSNLPPDESAAIKAVSWKGKTVLDVGCGTGLMCALMIKAGAKKAVGIDYSAEAINEARSTHKDTRLEYKAEDLFRHKGRYDVVVSLGTLEHMDNPLKALQRMKSLLNPKGVIVLTSPNWLNPRGYILQTLLQLFDAPITLADIHYLTPIEYSVFAKKLGMKLTWSTFDFSWAHGPKLIKDFTRRLPNVFRDMKITNKKKQIHAFISWIETHILPFNHSTPWSGATGLYVLKSNNRA